MTTTTREGSPQFPAASGNIRPSTQEEMDAAIQTLQAHKDAWVALTIDERISLLDRLIKDFATLADRMVAVCCEAKGIAADSPLVGEEWSIGPFATLKNLCQLQRSLMDIKTYGAPKIPGPVTTRADGQVVAQVFPQTGYERLLFQGVTAEVWMEPGVTADELPQTQALIYRNKQHSGKVALVLGAGNVASIPPTDALHKLFVEDQVVILKMNPVNSYLGPLIEESFRALVEPGFLRVVYGGAEEGAYLCKHDRVEEIHITGSDKTFDAIVFGTGPEGEARKAENRPLSQKRVTGELGNVSPIIVVPGPWRSGDLAYQAEHIVTSLTTNAGFNCNATRVIIQHAGWEQREQLLQQMRKILGQLPTRNAYYPGAQERHHLFIGAHPGAEQFGVGDDKRLPWTLITGVDSQREDDICFTTEAFCGLFAETTLDAVSVVDYIDRAVSFANERLWGSLNATIIVHPQSLQDPAIAAAVERAIANLRYGTIGINYWGGASFTLGVTTWGAFPCHTLNDVRSGMGVVHNTLMFSRAQKSVLRGPFRSIPTPPWFALRGNTASKVFPKLVALEAAPTPWKVPGILWSAFRS
ncbi:MAG: aldehyde dehydrogenase [Ktedonobacteraceae bacterium]|nr:aldehyde dehydrogenase [Ktedonobacteraceae bacterium]